MKKIIKKNQVIITALAIMIIIAGYLSFTKDGADDDLRQVNSQITNDDLSNQNNINDLNNVGDPNDNNITNDNNIIDDNNINNNDDDITPDTNNEDNLVPETLNINDNNELGSLDDILHTASNVNDNGELSLINEESDIPGEAVLVNSIIDQSYFFSSKLSREQTRSQLKASYEDIINNANVSEKDKKKASNNLLKLLGNAEKENGAEILLSAKGFDGVVVSITGDTVDVIVNTSEIVSEQQKAIIEDVIKRKTDAKVENIVITPVVVHE